MPVTKCKGTKFLWNFSLEACKILVFRSYMLQDKMTIQKKNSANFAHSPGTALPDRTSSAVYIFSGSFGWKSKTNTYNKKE